MHSAYWRLAVIVLLAMVVGAAPAAAAAECFTLSAHPSPRTLSQAWNASWQQFVETRTDLSSKELLLIEAALEIGHPRFFEEALRSSDTRAPLVEVALRAREILTVHELGALFSSLGPVQWMLVEEQVLATPLCNCQTIGGTCTYSGGPSGTCTTGCVSWTGDDGKHRVGICSAVEAEEPQER